MFTELYSTLPPGSHFRMQVIEDRGGFTVEQLDIIDGKVWNCTAWNTQPTLDEAIDKANS